jgi:hypothetical protein
MDWTRTITSTPSAVAATCKVEGGHFGDVGSGSGHRTGPKSRSISRKALGWAGLWW